MKKLLLLIALLAVTCISYARKEYCFVKLDITTAKIYGVGKNNVLCDSTGKELRFAREIYLINEMAKRGWTLEMKDKDGYIMSREVPDSTTVKE